MEWVVVSDDSEDERLADRILREPLYRKKEVNMDVYYWTLGLIVLYGLVWLGF